LDFLIKIGAIIGVEKGMIQVRQGHGNNIHALPKHGKYVTSGQGQGPN